MHRDDVLYMLECIDDAKRYVSRRECADHLGELFLDGCGRYWEHAPYLLELCESEDLEELERQLRRLIDDEDP